MREEEPKIRNNEELIQKCIDIETGKDITGEVIASALQKLEVVADAIIQSALAKLKANIESKKKIYEDAYWDLHQKLGQGSIGPATAAAGPLMYSKMDELGDLLDITEEERL